MKPSSRRSVAIHIDRLTNSIRNAVTGDVFDTEVHALTARDKPLLKTGWSFDWRAEMRAFPTFKLVITDNPTVIQGLISVADKGDHIFINLVENAYFNIGKGKVYEGVGGNLFAFACQRSMQAGYEGVVSFIAKSTLIGHYTRTLGAQQLGASSRMVIDTPQARQLIQRYFPPSS